MSFLTPLFLLGALAIAGPIIYHLIRRTTRERTVFSSLMFLLPSPPRISRRHRLDNILLLILRCAALALLALGFARPFFTQAPINDPTAAQPKRTVLLIDTSASMRRDGAWTDARQRADAVLRRAAPTDHVAIYAFDRQPVPVLTFEEWNRTPLSDRVALAASRLGALSPGWGGTHVGNALITAAEALAETETRAADGRTTRAAEGPREVVLVSDLQAGSRLDALQAYEWPKGVSLLLEPVKARNPTNAGLQLVADAPDTARAADAAVRVRVSNAGDSKRDQFKVGWREGASAAGFVGEPIDAYVPPGQSRVFALPVPKDRPVPARQIALTGDDEPFDNLVHVIPPVQQQAAILWLGREPEDDIRQPLFFLRRAFSDTPRLSIRLHARNPEAPLPPDELKSASVVFVPDALPAGSAAALRQRVQEGKIVVFVPRGPRVGETIGQVLGREPLPLGEVKPPSYAMFSEIDFRHPLFAPFADPRFSDFTKIHIWRYRRIDAAGLGEARIVAKFDTGDPAVIEVPLGRGRVFILAAGWHPDDSQLAVSSKFVPLLWSLLELGGNVAPVPTQFSVGEAVAIPADGAVTALKLPDGATTALPAAGGDFDQTRQPGIYEWVGATGRQFAVNLDANESRTTPLDPDELRDLGVPVAKAAADEAGRGEDNQALLQGIEAESRQKLWRWLIAATLAVLLVESMLAGWTARRATLRTEEAAT